MRTQPSNPRTRISRAEAEALCLLEAVGPDGSTPAEITARLGLDAGLVGAVLEATLAIAGSGRLIVEYEQQDSLTPVSGELEVNDVWGLLLGLPAPQEIRALRLSELGMAALCAARG